MAKPKARTYSRYALQALELLGTLVRTRRTEMKMTAQQLAVRAGISRDMLHRIEKGDPRCEIGVVFELAAILGIPLFASEFHQLQARTREVEEKLTLLPRKVRSQTTKVNDEF